MCSYLFIVIFSILLRNGVTHGLIWEWIKWKQACTYDEMSCHVMKPNKMSCHVNKPDRKIALKIHHSLGLTKWLLRNLLHHNEILYISAQQSSKLAKPNVYNCIRPQKTFFQNVNMLIQHHTRTLARLTITGHYS